MLPNLNAREDDRRWIAVLVASAIRRKDPQRSGRDPSGRTGGTKTLTIIPVETQIDSETCSLMWSNSSISVGS